MKQQNANLSASIDVEINGILALTTYTLTYINTSEVVEEAIYHFTLPRMSAMIGCKVHIAGRIFEGEVRKRQDASEIYEQALADGKRTVLIESMNDGVYAINAGNLSPAQQIDITLVIGSAISAVSGSGDYIYRLPTNIAPRYRGTDNDIEPTFQVFARYRFKATIRSNAALNITSSSHAIVELEGALTFQGVLDRDIFLSWRTSDTTTLFNGTYAGHTYTLGYPVLSDKKQTEKVPGTVQIILDRSGSMDGASIILARQALGGVVSRLDRQTKLNVVSFGSRFDLLFSHPKAMDGETKKHARQYLSTVEADMGGTELQSALISSLRQFSRTEEQNHAVLITDGHVHIDRESQAAITLLCQQRNVHLHIIGVCYGVNEHLLYQLDSCSDGVLHVVNPNQDLTSVIDNIGQLVSDGSETMNMHWEDKPEWGCLPKVHYHGFPQLAICNGHNSIKVEQAKTVTSITVSNKWAQVLVSVAATRHMIGIDNLQAETLAESLGLLTKFTSFVMVDKSEQGVEGHAQTKVIAQMLPPDSGFSVCDGHAAFSVSASKDFDYADIPAFLRKQSDSNSLFDSTRTSEAPELLLLEELEGLLWRKARWSRRYLLTVGLSESLIDTLTEIADKHGVTLVDAIVVYLKNYAQLERVRLLEKVHKKLQKAIVGLSDDFIKAVTECLALYDAQ